MNAICAKCKHLLKTSSEPIWYNYYCKLTEREPEINCVTGKLNDEICDLFDHCRNINIKGNCNNFEPDIVNSIKRKWLKWTNQKRGGIR